MSYSVSAILDGHSNDVRCLTPFPGGSLVSGSRDKTVKLWASSDGQGWSTQVVYEGHTHYVSCVSVMPPNDEYKEGLIYTGSNDAKIRAYVPYSVQPDHTLEGHSATVASLFISKNQTLLSCSWDTTAKVWLNKRTVMTLQDHEVALWCGVILSEIGFMVTGAADGNLKVWKAGQCKATIKAHSQAVRDLAVISRDEVVSCSNDGRICYWRIDNANCNAVMSMSFEDVDFVYSIFAVDAGAMVVSSGENTGIKIFKEGKLSQTLGVPALSAWNVCILDSGDIAVGCSDNRIYIFTSDDNRKASPEIVALYEAEMNNVHQQESMDTQEELPEEIGGVKVADMPGPEGLNIPGKRNGQTKMVRDGNHISVHSWSEPDGKWSKVGDVVGQPKGKDSSGRGKDGGKITFEGVEYDHVFHIDVDEGIVLKLPYNNGQDPYNVAQDFIHKHELPQDYLQQIADFVIKNSNAPIQWQTGSACDPFTGGNAYVSGSGGVPTSSASSACDPFTGGNAYVSGSGGVTASSFTKKPNGAADPFTGGSAYTTNGDSGDHDFFPQKEFLKFSTVPKMEALKSKLLEFNEKVPSGVQLSKDQLEEMVALGNDSLQPHVIVSLLKVLRWPKEMAFPGIDIVRLALLNPSVCEMILAKHSDELVDILLQHLATSDRAANQMLALKSLANLFASDNGMKKMVSLQATIIEQLSALFPVENKQAQVAMATVLLNYAIVATSRVVNAEAQITCINLALLFVQGMTDSEAKFRNMVTLGTLLKTDSMNVKEARKLDAKEKIEAAKLLDTTEKVGACATALIKIL